MQNRRYSFTETGNRSIELAGLSPGVVWSALQGPTLWWRHGPKTGTEYGRTTDGQHIAVGLEEGGYRDRSLRDRDKEETMTILDPLARLLADAPDDELEILAPSDKESEPPMLKTSIRLPLELMEWAKGEATQRGLDSFSRLLRDLLEREREALADDTPVTTTRAEIQRALNQVLHRSQAA